jgi:phosphate transport system substrate-binding protein
MSLRPTPLGWFRRGCGLAALGFLASLPAGCGEPEAPAAKKDAPAAASPGESVVTVDGSSTVFRISRAAQEGFAKVDNDIEVTVGNSGTGGGFTKYLAGEIDIVDASRPAKESEETKAKEQGIEWVRFLVGYDGITVVVNPKNEFVKELSVQQLKSLWEPDSKFNTWRDLDVNWPDREIKLYSPDDKSGTFEFFTEVINGKAKAQRTGVQMSSDDNILVRGVGGDPDAIGYFGYAYFKANADSLRAIPIKKSKDSPAIAASPETILEKTYAPLSRPLFIYVKKSALRRPGAGKFVKYYLENVADLAVKGGYVAPTAEDIAENKKALEAAEAKGPGV